MILSNKIIDTSFEGEELESTKMEMDADSFAFFMQMVSKFYADNIGSPIRELFSNGWDSHQKAGTQAPIVVKLAKNKTNGWEFSVKDQGLGIDKDLVENVIKKYGKSTKRGDAKSLGAFGLGFKSPLAYSSAFFFVGWKDGVECKWMMREGEEGNEIDLIYEKETTELNGAEVIMNVDYGDQKEFSDKIREQLCYFGNSYIVDEYKAFNNDYKIYQTEDFKWSEMCDSNEMHLCLGDVYYPIDWNKLGISRINVPVGLKFSLTDGIEPLPARESFKYNNNSKKLILDKIKVVADWFVNKYNESVKEFDTFLEAYKYIDTLDYVVTIEGKTFNISTALKYSKTPLQEPRVKGIVLNPLKLYKYKSRKFIEDEYNVIAYDNYRGQWKTKYLSYQLISDFEDFLVVGKPQAILCNGLSGNVKEYLRDKYGLKTIYLSLLRNATLGKNSSWGYRAILKLDAKPKSEWRELIKEWQFVQKQVLDKFLIDETKVEWSKEYLDWLEDKKQRQKANRAKGMYVGKYLNKQVGDVTIAYSRLSALDKSSIVFEKKVFPIKDLYKNKFITLYWEDTPENKQIASRYHHLTTCFKLKIALIGKKELTKIPKLHNFMQEQDYIKTAQFRKLATAIKAKKVIDIFDSIYNGHVDVIKNLVGKYYEDVQTLKKYYETNWSRYIPGELISSVMVIAEEHNYFDLTTMVIVDRVKKDIERFDFIPMLKVPSTWDTEALKKYSKVINQMLLFRKLYHKQFPDFDIVEAPPVEVLENMYLVDAEGKLDCPTCEQELEEVA